MDAHDEWLLASAEAQMDPPATCSTCGCVYKHASGLHEVGDELICDDCEGMDDA